MVISWLLNSVSYCHLKSVVVLCFCPLLNRYGMILLQGFTQSHIPRVYQVRKELVSLTQGNKTLSVYYTRFRALLDEPENLNLLPKCTCDCVCGNAILQAKNDNITKVSQFLMGLNPQFSDVRSQILLMPILPSLNEAYAQHYCYKRRNKSNVLCFTLTILQIPQLSWFKKFGSAKSKSKLIRDYCKDTGHTREKCFALNGYPPWFKGPRIHLPVRSDNSVVPKHVYEKNTQFVNSFGSYKGKYPAQAAQVSHTLQGHSIGNTTF